MPRSPSCPSGALGEVVRVRAGDVRVDVAGGAIAFFARQSTLSRCQVQISFTHLHLIRAVIGAALYLAVIALFSLALGTILRDAAGRIATFAAILFVIPPLMNVLAQSWNDAISPYLPSNAGRAILSLTKDPSSFAPCTGLAVFCA